LNAEESTRLCTLRKDLAPAVIYLMRPENAPKILRGEVQASRQNLGLILNGDPAAKPLFAV
jgi:hypothetical protein